MIYQKIGCIKNLEVSSICNLSCPYCPCAGQGEHRRVGLMEWSTFEQTLKLLELFVKNGTQQELNLFGVGEPLLHPRYVEMVKRCRAIMPRYLCLRTNTNGILAEEKLIRDILNAGIDAIDVTDHNAKITMITGQLFRHLSLDYPKVRFGYSRDAVVNPNNWGELVDWTTEPIRSGAVCPWLKFGQIMVTSMGEIVRCCQDAHARGILGTVWGDPYEMIHTPYIQCNTCHEDIPEGMAKIKEIK